MQRKTYKKHQIMKTLHPRLCVHGFWTYMYVQMYEQTTLQMSDMSDSVWK